MTLRNTKKWDWAEARHLLNRAGFGGRPDEIEAGVAAGKTAAVESLFAGASRELAAPGWLAEYDGFSHHKFREMPLEKRKTLQRRNREHIRDFQLWWLTQMVEAETPAEMLHEKMAFFWHGHFATSVRKVKLPPLLFAQVKLFHRHATGSFRDLLHGIVADPAMLRYLDNNKNRKGKPNENLARELLELFSLGPGNYTEKDIQEGARALTGWTLDGFNFQFRPRRHDFGRKTFLGQTGDFDGNDIVDIILQQPACALFITRKVLDFLGFTHTDRGFVEEIATEFHRHYDIQELLRSILSCPEFYHPSVMGNQIKGPVRLVVGTARTLRLTTDQPQFFLHMLDLMGQLPFLPPNVKGWPPGRAWIDTSRLLTRFAFSEIVGHGRIPAELAPGQRAGSGGQKRSKADRQMRRLRKLRIDFDPEKLVAAELTGREAFDQVSRILLAVSLSDDVRQTVLARHQTRLNEIGKRDAGRMLIADLMSLPEYQLC